MENQWNHNGSKLDKAKTQVATKDLADRSMFKKNCETADPAGMLQEGSASHSSTLYNGLHQTGCVKRCALLGCDWPIHVYVTAAAFEDTSSIEGK
ncbi:hypothetical protein Y032_0156g3131 [Ancylostoma ceylanicum]|uniref:Uncharacterized protein n=1 Tax=Ancylostoma ceylanicum TaxID=53326 RepID=A0A016SZ81_9BILA|nr:hypothetical protein Y032_0156g3131 [Ancylostoma ceylanicum]